MRDPKGGLGRNLGLLETDLTATTSNAASQALHVSQDLRCDQTELFKM